jgi:hypothetical protein
MQFDFDRLFSLIERFVSANERSLECSRIIAEAWRAKGVREQKSYDEDQPTLEAFRANEKVVHEGNRLNLEILRMKREEAQLALEALKLRLGVK